MIDHAPDDAAYLSRKLADRFRVSSSSFRSPLRLVSQLALQFVLVCQRILSGRLQAPLLAESPYDILCIGPLPCRQLPMRIEEEDRSDGTSFQETGKGGLDLLLDLHRQHVWNGLHRWRLLSLLAVLKALERFVKSPPLLWRDQHPGGCVLIGDMQSHHGLSLPGYLVRLQASCQIKDAQFAERDIISCIGQLL